MQPDAVVVERVFFQTNVRTAMATGQAGGLALLVAAEAGLRGGAVQRQRGEAGRGRIRRRHQGPGADGWWPPCWAWPEPPKPPDVADALALAVCHLTAQPLRRAIEAAGSGRRP